jgi:2,3-bisphosphoglycerate-independent phosphoglycerate mutase
MRKSVLIIPDGAADKNRSRGASPLGAAYTPNMDFLAREGVCGLMQTLYENLPKESMVAQMGMLGWDPRIFYPHGRASCELLALDDVSLNPSDIVFRANLVRMQGSRLASYNADYIRSREAALLVEKINQALAHGFPEFELYHNSDFRNSLIIRDAGIDPRLLICPEPHENHGMHFDLDALVQASDVSASGVVARLNHYIASAAAVLRGECANAIFPWSASGKFLLPPFQEIVGFSGRTAVVGSMDFLHGISKAGKIQFFKVGNGRPDTDYRLKGRATVDLLTAGCEFVLCHINAPDEASHMADLPLKIQSLEQIDYFIVGPIVEYFKAHPDELAGVMVVPDHYSNICPEHSNGKRSDIHSIEPVPFALWNGHEKDATLQFSEGDAINGKYASTPVSHLELLELLSGRKKQTKSFRQQIGGGQLGYERLHVGYHIKS